MDAELEAYDHAWKTLPKDERNAVCQQMADDYVAAHPELVAKYGHLTIPQLVSMVSLAREAGDEASRIEIDIWINAAFEYQSIGGQMDMSGRRRLEVPAINADGDRRQGG